MSVQNGERPLKRPGRNFDKNRDLPEGDSCFNKKNAIGYYAVIMLHELGHLALRYKCATTKEFLDYESDENAFISGYKETNTLINVHKKLQRERGQKSEAGFQLELSILGQRLTWINTLSAKFLSNPKNWGKKNFKKDLKKKNSLMVFDGINL